MDSLNVLEILKLGLPGLVFMLSILSFRLLGKEQEKSTPNDRILFSIRQFMYINVGLAVLTVTAPLIESQFAMTNDDEKSFPVEIRVSNTNLKAGTASVCRDAEYVGRYLLISNLGGGSNALTQVAGKPGHPCSGEEVIFLSQMDFDQLNLKYTDDSALTLEVTAAERGYKFDINEGEEI